MKKKRSTSLIWLICLILIFAGLAIIFKHVHFILISGLIISFICWIIVLQGILIMSNTPPFIGVITKFGKREWKKDSNGNFITVYITEGWWFLFLKGFVYGYVPISIIKRENDFDKYILLTPDKATTKVPVSIAYVPNGEYAVNYLNLGKNDQERDAMVVDWFDNILGNELRQWTSPKGTEPGPKTWEDLTQSKDNAASDLIDSIFCSKIPDDHKKLIGNGFGSLPIKNMGINLIRLSLPPMTPFGPIYDASVAKGREDKERDSEITEIETDMLKAAEMLKLQQKLKEKLQSEGVTVTEAELKSYMETVMRWKVQREGINNLSLSALATTIVDAIKGGNHGNSN